MSFNINEILASLDHDGVVQSNKFNVQFALPVCLEGASISSTNQSQALSSTGNAAQLVMIRGCGARIPDVLIQTMDVNRSGIGVLEKMPYNVGFTETELTFIVDKNGVIFNLFYAWVNAIFDFSGMSNPGSATPTYLVEYKDNVVVDLQIWLYDNWGNTVNTIVMQRAFPLSMSDVPLDWGTNNELVKLSVRMPFTNWYYKNTTVKLPSSVSIGKLHSAVSTPVNSNVSTLLSQFQ